MWKSCDGWVKCLVERRLRRGAIIVGVVVACGLYGPPSMVVPSAVAQERESPRTSAPGREGIGATVDTDDGPDTQWMANGAARQRLIGVGSHLDFPHFGADRRRYGRDRRDVVLLDGAGRLDGDLLPYAGRHPTRADS